MKIGITGASGFLGSSLLKYLAELDKYDLFALTRNLSLEKVKNYANVIWVKGDLTSSQVCEDFVKELDLIIHLAHTNTPINSNKDILSDTKLNLLPTLNLLQAVRDSKRSPHLVYASTGGAIYKPSHSGQPFQETDPCEPSSSYGIQKLTVENYLRLSAAQGWLSATSLRIGNPYGTLLPSERMQGLIGVVLNQVLHHKPVKNFGDPNNVRDYVHLEDMCRMFDLIINKQSALKVYNVGSAVNQILDLIEGFAGVSMKKEVVQTTIDTNQLPSWIVLDITKSYKNVGWEPSIKLEQGLKDLCEQQLWN